MGAALQRAWLRRGPLAWLLWPASLVFGALAAIRRSLYRWEVLSRERVRVPVVVVGNVIAGGTGKTPVVIALVEHLRHRGLQPGVVSRGWGRSGDRCLEVRSASNPAEVGDEPLLIARATGVPVFVGHRRAEAAAALLRRHPRVDIIVCDDGLQHLALHRDIEICVYDQRLSGNGFLLPAGPLRERMQPSVNFVLCDEAALLPGAYGVRRELAGNAIRPDGTVVPLARLGGGPILAVAGIARPQAFFDMLRLHHLNLTQTMALPDHHEFDAWAAPAPEVTVLCTEKDAVKLWQRQPGALAVPLRLTLSAAFLDAFDRLLDAKLSLANGPQTS